MASYVVRIDDMAKVIAGMEQLAREVGGTLLRRAKPGQSSSRHSERRAAAFHGSARTRETPAGAGSMNPNTDNRKERTR